MPSVSEELASRIAPARERAKELRETAEKLLVDIAGLCVAARKSDYVLAAVKSWESAGACTAIGHSRALDSAGAAFVNGTAAHGEDFDDTFEGGPVHAGAVVVPAVLAISERDRLKGADALAGIAVGCELVCRASLVAPKRIHKAGFHPTAVLGALGAAAGIATALRFSEEQFVNALG
ncbi:MAG TPA: MmgE/PrpD family protein, partial [Sphingomicrobium sp.]|nr:MmgE/PrpD family protein [Sphingomicrobium sp.]